MAALGVRGAFFFHLRLITEAKGRQAFLKFLWAGASHRLCREPRAKKAICHQGKHIASGQFGSCLVKLRRAK